MLKLVAFFIFLIILEISACSEICLLKSNSLVVDNIHKKVYILLASSVLIRLFLKHDFQ